MKRLFLAMLCAAPLMAGTPAEPAQPVAAVVEPVYYSSMGCTLADCADPTHYHHCAEGCVDPAHYHDCQPGCVDTAHGHSADCRTEPVYYSSMGCTITDCADPTHYHHCAEGCTDPAHYHNCRPGCDDAAHGHSRGHHESRGHHGGRHC